MKRLATALFIYIASATAVWAQGAVQQVGPSTIYDLTAWIQDHLIESASKVFNDYGRGVNPLHTYDAEGMGSCWEDASTSGPYHQLCITHDANGNAIISAASQNGAPPGSLMFNVNGVISGPGAPPQGNLNPDIWAIPGIHPPADSWMNTAIPITGGGAYKYMVPITDLLTQQTTGQIAVTGGSRSSDSAGTCCTMGGAFVAVNDNTAKPQSVWPLYVSGTRQAGTGSIQLEVDIANLDSNVHDLNPYAGSAGMSVPLVLHSGGEAASPGGPTIYPTSAMLDIDNNGGYTRHGIVFGSGLFDSSSYCYQQTCPAIDMPYGDEIRWVYDTTDTYGSYVRGLNKTAGSGNGIVLTASGTVFTNTQGQQLAAVINNPGSGNGGFVELTSTGLNGDAAIEVGTNGAANASLQLQAMGTGEIILNGPVQFNTATQNPAAGTPQTFTNTPCANKTSERWLPVILQGLGTWYLPACQ